MVARARPGDSITCPASASGISAKPGPPADTQHAAASVKFCGQHPTQPHHRAADGASGAGRNDNNVVTRVAVAQASGNHEGRVGGAEPLHLTSVVHVRVLGKRAAATAAADDNPASVPGSGHAATDRNRRSRRLLETTNTDEKAMANPAIIGLSRPSAASGSAATL